jgi:hypothetical protein
MRPSRRSTAVAFDLPIQTGQDPIVNQHMSRDPPFVEAL